MSANPYFATKSMARLEEEMRDENRLRRILGPIQLTSLGVGAIIGAGIFVATGRGGPQRGRVPRSILSYVVAGLTCIFAALCYAEFASMVPVAGSAYTYAYATMGELFAWIIGWDLVLEYAVGSATVATGWSGYFQNVLNKVGIHVRSAALMRIARGATTARRAQFMPTGSILQSPGDRHRRASSRSILVKGIQESASFNAAMVMIKLAAVLFVIGVGAFFVDPANWHPFAPYGWTGVSFFGKHVAGQTDPGGSPVGMLAGAAIIFFAYIGFDSVSTHAEEAKNPQRDVPDRHHRLARHLHGPLHRRRRRAHGHGQVRPARHQRPGQPRLPAEGHRVGRGHHRRGRRRRDHVRAPRHDAERTARLPRDGARRPRADRASSAPSTRSSGRPGSRRSRSGSSSRSWPASCRSTPCSHLTNIGTLLAFVIVCAAVLHHAADESRAPTGPSAARGCRSSRSWAILTCLLLMFSLPTANWWRLFTWLGIGLVIYFFYGRHHSVLQKDRDRGIPAH